MEKKNKKKRGKQYTKKQILNAIEGSYGIMLNVSKKLKCNWNTARKYVYMYEETKEAFDKEFEAMSDLAEHTIFGAIKEGDTFTAKWFLGLMKEKYKEKAEIEVNHKGEIKFKFGNLLDEEEKEKK